MTRSRIREYFERIWQGGDISAEDEIYAPDVVVHGAPPGSAPGLEGVKQTVGMFRGAFPDIVVTTEDLVAAGDRVVQRWRIRGTQEGPVMGIPPTGRTVDVEGINIFRMEGGRIVERWGVFDAAGLRMQLVPPPAAGG